LATFVATINDSADDQLSAVIQHFEWHFPRSDLFQFISILNRFDKILEETCQKYQLDSIQKNPFTTQEKYTLLAIARCSRILFENCTNRNLYNSYEVNTCL
jgi:E3 ubiquitin-protein ligase HUWE1